MKSKLISLLLIWTAVATAADVPIKNLPAASMPLSSTDAAVLEQSAGTRKATISQLQTTFFSNLAPSATIDTTNASNISHGLLALGLFPGTLSSNTSGNAATATAFASLPSACSTGTYSTGIDIFGNSSCGSIAAVNVSGLSPSATVDTTNAANITSGVISLARLPPFTGYAVDCSLNTCTNIPASQIVGSLNVASLVGTWGVLNGGTGVTSLTGIVKGNGASAFSTAASSDLIATFSGAFTDSSHYLATDGSRQALVVGSPSNVQIFASAGTATWTKPAGTPKMVIAYMFPGGGGGGGGAQVASGTAASGGAAGGGGMPETVILDASLVGATETVTIGAGGTGGTAGSAGSGGNGSNGSPTSFGAWKTAYGGGAGQGGQTSNNVGGGGGGPYSVGISGSGGGTAGGVGAGAGGTSGAKGGDGTGAGGGGASATGAVGGAGGNSIDGCTGGGAGGGLATTPVAQAGGAGGRNASSLTAAPGGGASTSGSTRTLTAGIWNIGGLGGGGGGSSTAATAGAGGAGTRCGGGGGGGAALTTTATAGAGAVGGDGYAVVVTTF